MGGICSKHGRHEKCIKYFGWNTWREELLGRPRRRWEDNFRMNRRKIGWEVVDWINLAQDMNTVMEFREKADNFLSR